MTQSGTNNITNVTTNAWNRPVVQPNQDASSVYYIHPSDANTAQLVSVKFSGTGYSNWKRSMMLSLSAKNKLGFVDGTIAKPVVTSGDEFKAWERCNDLVCSWLLCNLDDSLSRSVLFFKTAREIWLDLEDRFGYASMTQIFSLEQQLVDANQGSKSVSDFFTEMKTLWDAMSDVSPLPCCTCNKCTCNVTQKVIQMDQDRRLLQFMMKLSDRFANVRANILMQQPLPSLSNAFRMFSQEERHQEISHPNQGTETLAFMADSKKNFQKGWNAGKGGGNFSAANSSTVGFKKGGNFFCTHCKIAGHTVDRCFKIHGYPPNFKFKDRKVAATTYSGSDISDNKNDNKTDSTNISVAQFQQLMSLLNKQSNVSSDTQDQTHSSHALLAGKTCLLAENSGKVGWLIDSGATDHICSDLRLFHSYKPVTSMNEFITVPDGRQIPILHTGSVKLNEHMVLNNVLHIPLFQYNLISVQKICKDMQCTVSFNGHECLLQDHLQKKSPIPLGSIQGGLYSTGGITTNLESKSILLSVKEDISIWHLRLGHVPFGKIKHIPALTGLQHSSNLICQVCPMAKQTKSAFTHSCIKTFAPFELIHIDVWGPYKVKSHTGCNQFITIVDDFSRFTWVHMLKHRTDCVKVMVDFLAHIETQYSSKVIQIRSDNAPELCQGPMKDLFLKKGIFHQTSCSYTPQQNGVVERKHRHLLETARALFFQSKIPAQYWSETILCAAYIINRIPLQSINNDTPYFRLTGDTPSLDHFKVFGSLCYVSTISENRSKFDSRANACVFLGYSVTQKGYKVMDLTTKTMFVSRNVVFHETHFPFHSHTQPTLFPSEIYLPSYSSNCDVENHTYSFPSVTELPPVVSDNIESPNSFHDSVDSSNLHDLSDSISSDSQSVPVNIPSSEILLRKSTRTHKPPSYLTSYKCNSASTSTHWCNLVQVSIKDPAPKCSIKEPVSYQEAAADPMWVTAMQNELKALHLNQTWDLVPLPTDKKAIGSRWVFKVKLKADGSLERCKARLVAKGYNQKHGIDYEETFSPVVKMSTVRLLLSLAASRHWKLHQLDVNNAFLHGTLKEEVYMTVPEGIPNPHNYVCLLRKSIYGLKQASREWHAKLVEELLCQGFTQSKNDYSLFIKRQGSSICVAAVYVDDIILTGNDDQTVHSLKAHLDSKFGIKDLGILHYFLGIEVSYSSSGIILCQHKFAKDLIAASGFDVSQYTSTPLPVHLKLSSTEGDFISQPELYRTLVGKLNYLTNSRPDLSYTVQVLSQYMHAPRTTHLAALQHTLRYLAGTLSQGILLNASDKLTLQAFSDADWASCADTRRSVTGYILLFGSSPVSWKSKKQTTVSRSSAEAEYRAMASAAAEVTWVVRLLEELGVQNLQPVTLHCDNQSALHIAKNPVFHERTKHIELDCHFTRDKVLEGLLQLTYLPTRSQLADVLTKVSPSPHFNSLLCKLGMLPSPTLRGAVE